MWVTWSDTESSESEPLRPKEDMYDQKDFLAFTTSMVFDNDSASGSDIDENAFIIENWCEEYQLLLK